MQDTQNQSQNSAQDNSFPGQDNPTWQSQDQSQTIPASQATQFSDQGGSSSQFAQNQQLQNPYLQSNPSPSTQPSAVGGNSAITPSSPYSSQGGYQAIPTPVTDSSQIEQPQAQNAGLSQGQMPQSMNYHPIYDITSAQDPYSQQYSNPTVLPSGPQPIQSQPDPYTSQDQNQTAQTTGGTSPTQNPYPQEDLGQYNSNTGGQTPYGQVQDPYTTSDDVQPLAPISVHTGTPESAPMPVAPEVSNEDSVEYGYEKLKQIENGGMELEKIENKESLSQQPQDEIQSQPKQEEVVEPTLSGPTGPKIFGYQIPQSITSNLSDLRARKGTGDPAEAKTWIYILLDKLLKKQTYQKENG